MKRRLLMQRAMNLVLAGLVPSLLLAGDAEGDDPANLGRFGFAPPAPKTILGVHTRLTDEVEYWKISKTLDMVRSMGAGWTVELFPWAYIEPRHADFDWAHPDFVIREANRQGLEMIARLDFVPDWARPKDSTPRRLSRDHYADFAGFAARFAQRYQHAVRYFVIWNEPNTAFELGFEKIDAAAYVDLLAVTSKAIRSVHPTAKVLPAGLAPTVENSDLAQNDLGYLQSLYDHGLAQYVDALCSHSYGWKFPPDSPASPDRVNFARVELMRQVMEKNKDGDKPILMTESGWNDDPRWTKAVHPGQRILYTLRALQMATTNWPWMQALCLWCFRLPAPSHDYNDYFTLVDTNFRAKPIYDQIRDNSRQYFRSN